MAITLHYFDLYARGETSRIILHYNGAEFTDHRISFEEWPKIRDSGFCEFYELPTMEIDDLKLVQSHCLSRYLCQKFGYVPSNHTDEYYSESICDLKEDIYRHFANLTFSKNFEQLEKDMQESAMPWWLQKIEARLVMNQGGDGWFVGNNPTRADFEIFQLIYDYLICNGKEAKYGHLLDTNSPKLKAFINRLIQSSPRLANYLSSRPSCFF
jgi:glutathione S-transferase